MADDRPAPGGLDSLNAQAAHFFKSREQICRVATSGRVQHAFPVIVQPVESTFMLAGLARGSESPSRRLRRAQGRKERRPRT
jgi:hypothetical protein